MFYRNWLAVLAAFIFISGCMQTAKISREKIDSGLKLPSDFTLSGTAENSDGKWWEVFQAEELNSLMGRMIANNNQILGSYEGLRALQAVLNISEADKMPSVTAGASAGEKYSTDTRGEREWNDSYEISLTASYEVDIWGRIKAGAESDRMSLLSSRYDLESLHMSLTAELAERYFIYKSLGTVLRIQREMLLIRQQQLDTIKMMYSAGVGNLDTIYVKQTAIADLTESITETIESMKNAKYQIAKLIGEPDVSKLNISDNYELRVPVLPSVIPSEIAEKRPDIRAAYSNVLKVNSDLAEAMANRYPKLSFSASAAYSGADLDRLFTIDNFILNLVANLTAPIFDAGKLKNKQKQQEFLLKKEIYDYYDTVLSALNEVRVSLNDNIQNEKALELNHEKVSIEEKRLKVADMKYEMGIEDYSGVLDYKIALLSAWVSEVNSKRALISSRIELARVAGGSWAGDVVKAGLSKDLQEKK